MRLIDRVPLNAISIAYLVTIGFILTQPSTDFLQGVLFGMALGGVFAGLVATKAQSDFGKMWEGIKIVEACHKAQHEHADQMTAERDAWRDAANKYKQRLIDLGHKEETL